MDLLPTVFDNISHFGPLARTLDDVSLFMQVCSGPDERDISSLPDRMQFPVPTQSSVAGLRIALSTDLGYYAVDPEVESALHRAAAALADLGAHVEAVDLGWNAEINDAWYQYWGVYLAVCFDPDLDQFAPRMDPNVVSLVEAGLRMDAASFKRIEVLRTWQWHKLCDVFEHFDLLLCPTTAHPAPEHGASDADCQGHDSAGRYRGLDMTCPFNFVAQCPALSVPSGFSRGGLPMAVQIVGHRFDDLGVLRAGAALESVLPWAGKKPAI